MTDCALKRIDGGFMLGEGEDPQLMANVPVGETIIVDLPQKFSKSRAQVHFYFGVLTFVWNNMPEHISKIYDDRDDFRYVMTVHLGYCKEYKTSKVTAQRAMSVKTMDHGTFNNFVNDSFDAFERIDPVAFNKIDLLSYGLRALHPVDKAFKPEIRK